MEMGKEKEFKNPIKQSDLENAAIDYANEFIDPMGPDEKLFDKIKAAFLEGVKYHASQSQEESKWISVKDRLPEIGQSVMVYPSCDNVPFGTGEGEELFGDERDNNFWHWNERIDDAELVKGITHWQPLPKPPSKP